MSDNTSALKHSFFKEYFRYKLRDLRGFTILFAVLNSITVTGFAAAVLIYVQTILIPYYLRDSKEAYHYGYGGLYYFIMFLYLMIGLIFLTVLMLSVMPAINFKFFNKREFMDTLGGLPLTVKQRFLGDMLSGAASFGLSFVPCSVIAVILAVITEFSGLRKIEDYFVSGYSFPWIDVGYTKYVLTVLLTILLSYAAAYAVSCFVTSCCGKVGTSVLFSLILLGVITILPLSIGGYIGKCTIGSAPDIANTIIISSTPPFGTIIALITDMTNNTSISFAVKTPLVLIMLLVPVLFGVGAYFAATRRKTERVDRELVLNAGYYVISAIITFVACSFCVWVADNSKMYIIPLLLISLGTCLVMAFLNTRSLKKSWKGAAVFAMTGLFSLGLTFLIGKTDGFGSSTHLPSKESIKSITLYGDPISRAFPSDNYMDNVTIDSEEGIELVLSEHQKIIDDLENYAFSSENYSWPLTISYNLKNGMVTTRQYSYIGEAASIADDPTYKFVDVISELPELYTKTIAGMIGNPEMPCTGMVYAGSDPNNIDHDFEGNITLSVRPSSYDKFAECYLEDLGNWRPDGTSSTFGMMRYNYIDKSGKLQTYMCVLWDNFDKTIEFLRDPDNFEEVADIVVDDKAEYGVTFRDGSNFMISFTITYPELAREFLSYLRPEFSTGGEELSQCFLINSKGSNNNYYSYSISKADEQAALSAFIKAIRAHQAISESSSNSK